MGFFDNCGYRSESPQEEIDQEEIDINDRAWRELVYLDEMIMGLEQRLHQNNFNPELTSLEVELAAHQLKLMRNCREAHSLRISLESKLL